MRSTDRLTLKAKVSIGAVSAALFLWFLPAFDAWLKSRMTRESVHALALWVQCERRPAEFERVVVIIDGTAGHQCVYVTARGAYGVTR